MTYALWTMQILLFALFLVTGGMKVMTPPAQLSAMMGLPGALLVFVGVSEILGAFGLILPGVFRFKTGLTPLAAAGLSVVAACAFIFHIATGDIANSPVAAVAAVLAGFVAYGRWLLAPLGGRQETRTLQPSR